MYGWTDRPATTDLFEIESYVKGLSSFIMDCNMPMTIAIQGEWGTGKTSMMEMVANELPNDKIIKVWFNTWQFS